MARKGNIYLGKKVADIGKKGLDQIKEVEGIARAIAKDRIRYATKIRRLNLLELIVCRDRDFQDPKKRRKARRIIDRIRREVMEKAQKRKKSGKKKKRR